MSEISELATANTLAQHSLPLVYPSVIAPIQEQLLSPLSEGIQNRYKSSNTRCLQVINCCVDAVKANQKPVTALTFHGVQRSMGRLRPNGMDRQLSETVVRLEPR